MRRVFASLPLLFLTVVQAQPFQSLATNGDGSVLYFSSPIRMKGSGQSLHSKIFRWTAAGGFELVADEPDEGTSDGCTTSKFFQLGTPQVSADGLVVAYTGSRFGGGKFCDPVETNQSIVRMPKVDALLAGTVALSANGRFAATAPLGARQNDYHLVFDLEQIRLVPFAIAGYVRPGPGQVTDDGTTITPRGGAVMLTDRAGTTRVLTTQQALVDAVIDPAGKTIVYTVPFGPSNPARIVAVDRATGKETVLTAGFAFSNVRMTADGQTVFCLNFSSGSYQAFRIGVNGENGQEITSAADPLLSFAVSGDGRILYGATTAGRLVRVDTASRQVTEIAPATPFVGGASIANIGPTTTVTPGMVIQLSAVGLGGTAKVDVCGKAADLLAGSRVRIPEDVPSGACLMTVQAGSPFEHALQFEVKQYLPLIGSSPIVHGGFRGIVSVSSPAARGEEIAAYFVGLGPVNRTGQLSTPGFTCSVGELPAVVTYAGSAPGYAGYYQVNVVIPVGAPSGASALACGWDEYGRGGAVVYVQ